MEKRKPTPPFGVMEAKLNLLIDRPALAHFTEIAGTCCTDERQLTLYRAARGRPDMTQRFLKDLR